MRINRLAAVFAMIVCGNSLAGDVILDVHGLSKHLNSSSKYNETNFGLGLSLNSVHFGVSFGRYHNSKGRMSNYTAMTAQTSTLFDAHDVRLAVELGSVSGYGKLPSPLIIPVVRIHIYDRIGVNLRYLPPIRDITPAVLSVSIGIKLN